MKTVTIETPDHIAKRLTSPGERRDFERGLSLLAGALVRVASIGGIEVQSRRSVAVRQGEPQNVCSLTGGG